jgi:hypothetical protein
MLAVKITFSMTIDPPECYVYFQPATYHITSVIGKIRELIIVKVRE